MKLTARKKAVILFEQSVPLISSEYAENFVKHIKIL